MKHISLMALVCLSVAAFAALYQRTTAIVVQALLEGLSRRGGERPRSGTRASLAQCRRSISSG
jgi:hypothetical protein